MIKTDDYTIDGISGARMFSDMSRSAYPRLPDDMTVGLVISNFLMCFVKLILLHIFCRCLVRI